MGRRGVMVWEEGCERDMNFPQNEVWLITA